MELNVSYLAKEYDNGWSLWIIRSDGRKNLLGSAIKNEREIDDAIGLNPITKERMKKVETNMNQVAAVKVENEMTNKQIAMIKFPESPMPYAFYTHISDLTSGDNVVVDSLNKYQVGTFLSYVNSVNFNVTKWVIQKVDLSMHKKRLQATEKIEKLEAMKKGRLEYFEKIKQQAIDADTHILEYEKEIYELKNQLK